MIVAVVAREPAIDVLRGFVMLLLVLDLGPALSELLANGSIDSKFLRAVADQFEHASWQGLRLWDVVMPAFVFVAGASMPFSNAKRRAHGDSTRLIWAHVVMRAATLVALGLVMSMPSGSAATQLLPLVLLVPGLPFATIGGVLAPVRSSAMADWVWLTAWALLVAAVAAYFFLHTPNPGIYESAALLVQLGLAIPLAYAFVGRELRVMGAGVVALLAVVTVAFVAYPAVPGGGPFAHWTQNSNVASAFDVWFFNLWPRTEPFELHSHGYQTLNFVPMTANVILGIMAGSILLCWRNSPVARRQLAVLAFTCAAGGAVCALSVAPIVKSIWTPSYALLTGTITLAALLVLLLATRHDAASRWTLPLVVLGSNSLLVYVLTLNYRWRFVDIWHGMRDFLGGPGSLAPLGESLAVAAMIGGVAYVLFKLRLFVRI